MQLPRIPRQAPQEVFSMRPRKAKGKTQEAATAQVTRTDAALASQTSNTSERSLRSIPNEIMALLRRRHYRQAVFCVLRDPALRQTPKVVRKLGRALARAGAGTGVAADGVAVLALRLGFAGVQRRGPAWDALHDEIFVRQGRLPTYEGVLAAIRKDAVANGRQCPTAEDVLQRLRRESGYAQPRTSGRSQAEYTRYFNTVLSRWLRMKTFPAISVRRAPQPVRSGHDPPGNPLRSAKLKSKAPPRPLDKERSQARRIRPLPTLDLRQLARLLGLIQKLVSGRSFRPDAVTAALVIKCWVRCLSVPPRMQDHHALWAGTQELEALWDRVRDGLGSGGSGLGVGHAGANAVEETLQYARHVRPIGNVFLKAFRRLNCSERAESVLDWMKDCRRAEEQAGRIPQSDRSAAAVPRPRAPARRM